MVGFVARELRFLLKNFIILHEVRFKLGVKDPTSIIHMSGGITVLAFEVWILSLVLLITKKVCPSF